MPATSQQQQKLFGLALAFKRGEVPASEVSDEIKAIADRMSETDIEDFASTKHKGLPKMKEQLRKIVRETMKESVLSNITEGRYDADLDKIEAAVKNASSFMNVGSELKKIGVKYDFSTSMIPMYRIKVSGNTIAIVNKKYASDAERTVKDIAIGLMENVIKESLSPEVAKHMGSIHKGFKMVENDGVMVYDSPTNAKKAADFLNSKKIAASFDGKYVYLESVNEAFKHIIHVDTPTQIVSKPIAAQIMALAKKGIRSKDIGLEMGFTGNAKLAADTFQKVKNQIYFSLDKRNESVVTESASKEAVGIAVFTGTRVDAVDAFIKKHNLDAMKLYKSIKSANLKGRLNFVSALVGNDGNPNQKLTIKLHQKNESVNEAFRDGTASHFNAELTKWAKKYNLKFDYKFKEKGKKSIPYFVIHTDVDDMDNNQTIELNKLTRLFHVDYRPIGKTLVVESMLNEEEVKWNAVETAIINFLKMNTKILDKRVKDRDTDGVKGGLQSIIDGLTNAQRSLKLKK
jgi:hypothetical protein